MVRTRAQRVANDEAGVSQSPQQVLSTPVRKPRGVATEKTSNGSIRNSTRNNHTNGKVSESEDSNGQVKRAKKATSRQATKKAKLRSATKLSNSQTSTDIVLADDNSEASTRGSVEPVEKPKSNGVHKRANSESGTDVSNKRQKRVAQPPRTMRNKTGSPLNDETTSTVKDTEQTSAPTNASLFNILSRRTPSKPESQIKSNSERTVSPVNEADEKDNASPEQEQIQGTRPAKLKTKSQRVLQEHGANKQKQSTRKSPLGGIKRKRVADDNDNTDDVSEAPESKKKTARWSFKPNNEGNLTLLPRDEIDPDDVTVIFVDGEEAAKLISQEFERKKQVRFADRIAKQHSELTEEEQAAQKAKLEAQNLQLTTHGFFGSSLPRGGDMRALARKLDAGNKTMLERIESLSTTNDEEFREDLARDLMELAFAIRAAGPQSKSISPVDQIGQQSFSNHQDNKENRSASVSPQQAVLQIEAPPSLGRSSNKTPQPLSTPARLFASIRKIGSYLPFGTSSPSPVQVEPVLENEDLSQSPISPTPVGRHGNGNIKHKISTTQSSPNGQIDTNLLNFSKQDITQKEIVPAQPPVTPQAQKSSLATLDLIDQTVDHNSLNNVEVDKQQLTPATKATNMVKEMNQKWSTPGLNKLPKTPGSLKRKIGSEAYPLTADGKIPRPAPNAWGMNEDYFYNADSSSESEEEEDEPLPKRRRMVHNGVPVNKIDNRKLSQSAPRPSTTTSRPPLKTPTPRVYAAPALDSSSSDENVEEVPKVSSGERRETERRLIKGQRLKDAAEVHKPKTPSRLREMATVPPSPIDPQARLRQYFTGKGTQGVFSVFAQI